MSTPRFEYVKLKVRDQSQLAKKLHAKVLKSDRIIYLRHEISTFEWQYWGLMVEHVRLTKKESKTA